MSEITPAYMTINNFMTYTGLGRTKVNELMGVEFDTIKVGTRRLIDMKSANAWLDRRLESERQRSAGQRPAN